MSVEEELKALRRLKRELQGLQDVVGFKENDEKSFAGGDEKKLPAWLRHRTPKDSLKTWFQAVDVARKAQLERARETTVWDLD